MTAIQLAAREAVKAGLSVVPPAEDGTKRPAPIWPARDGNAGSWAPFMKAVAEKSQLAQWWGPRLGLGVACGKVSGNLECFEFDDRATYDAFKSLAHDSEMDSLLSTLESGYVEDSPSGGVHWLYRCDTIGGNCKLANRPAGPNQIETLIEVRGEGGYVIVAPSGGPVHPSGKPYVLRGGGFSTIPTITSEERDDLYQLARALDEMPTQEYKPQRAEPASLSESRPGDDYTARATWGSILEPAGWKWLYRRGEEDYWRRPGKNTGMSASTNYGGFDFLKVFSSSTEFDTNQGYSKFSAYALLNHRGDYVLAAKVLAAKGYGAALTMVPKKRKAAPKTPVDAAVAEHELKVAATNVEMLANRQFGSGGEGRYLFMIPNAGISFDLDRVRRERHELFGELAVRCDLQGSQTVGNDASLIVADFNLSSLQARQTRAKLLAERSKAYELDWFGLLEDFCQRVILAERQGNPPISLRKLDRPEQSRTLDLYGWRVPSDHPTILFGDGGVMKSYFSLYACGIFAQQGNRVMFVDWELDGAEHRDRLERLFGANMPDILYVRAERPLVSEADRLKRIRSDERVDYTIYDSIAFACAGPPESAEIASEYFRAVRKIGGGSLHIAHVNRSETSDQKPFGSAFWHNGARSTWFAQQAETSPGQPTRIALINRKANLGPLQPALAFAFSFEDGQTSITRTEVTEIAEVSDKLPLWQRMKGALAHGPLTYAQLADEVGAKLDTVTRTVNRSDRMFSKLPGPGGSQLVYLAERRAR